MGMVIPSTGVIVVCSAFALLWSAALPTCLYLYVEPRGRTPWARPGDAPASRRAPALIRVTAWSTFWVAQLALVCGLVPVACGVLLYLQAKLGVTRSSGFVLAGAAMGLAVTQIAVALRLLPVGVRLLVGGAPACARAQTRARSTAIVSASVVAAGGALGWLMTAAPGLVRPWLRAALEWTALWPLQAYAAICFATALLLWQCARTSALAPCVTRGDSNR